MKIAVLTSFLITTACRLCAKTPGVILILYGTHCGGKTTLSEALIQQLGGDYEYVVKTPFVEQKRKDYIQQVTGVRPKHREEIFSIAKTLPPKQRRKALGFSREAIKATLMELKKRAAAGKNSIFAVCPSNLRQFDLLEGTDHHKILVYAPLREISKRELERSKQSSAVSYDQLRRRDKTLSNFLRLYQAAKSDDELFLDSLTSQDLAAYLDDSRRQGAYPEQEKTFREALKYFGLDERERVNIAPKIVPDFIVDTSKHSPQEGARRIIQYLEK